MNLVLWGKQCFASRLSNEKDEIELVINLKLHGSFSRKFLTNSRIHTNILNENLTTTIYYGLIIVCSTKSVKFLISHTF